MHLYLGLSDLLAVLRTQSSLCTQGSLLIKFAGLYVVLGNKSESPAYKANSLPALLSLWTYMWEVADDHYRAYIRVTICQRLDPLFQCWKFQTTRTELSTRGQHWGFISQCHTCKATEPSAGHPMYFNDLLVSYCFLPFSPLLLCKLYENRDLFIPAPPIPWRLTNI